VSHLLDLWSVFLWKFSTMLIVHLCLFIQNATVPTLTWRMLTICINWVIIILRYNSQHFNTSYLCPHPVWVVYKINSFYIFLDMKGKLEIEYFLLFKWQACKKPCSVIAPHETLSIRWRQILTSTMFLNVWKLSDNLKNFSKVRYAFWESGPMSNLNYQNWCSK
jgi:hypothetical protein